MTKIYEDILDVQSRIINTISPDRNIHDWNISYLPVLDLSDKTHVVSLRLVHIENKYLKISVAIDLGGRILEIFDKRTKVNLLPKVTALEPVPHLIRGVQLLQGLEWSITNPKFSSSYRVNSMGSVDYSIHDENMDANPTLLIHEYSPQEGLSWYGSIVLDSDSTEITLTCNAINRNFHPLPLHSGLIFNGKDTTVFEAKDNAGLKLLKMEERESGFVVNHEDCLLHSIQKSGDAVDIGMVPGDYHLMPFESVSWQMKLYPFSQIKRIDGASEYGVVGVDKENLYVQANRKLEKNKILLVTETDKKLELQTDFYPEHIKEVSLENVQESISRILIRDLSEQKDWVDINLEESCFIQLDNYQWDSYLNEVSILSKEESVLKEYESCVNLLLENSREDIDVKRLSYSYLFKHHALIIDVISKIRKEEYGVALLKLEQCAQYNSDSFLLWWLVAYCRRKANQDIDDALLNLHYLSNMDPLLKAESFLSQGNTDSSSMLASLSGNIGAQMDVLNWYYLVGDIDASLEWIDSCMKLNKHEMLFYAKAYIFIKYKKLDIEAAAIMKESGGLKQSLYLASSHLENKIIQFLTTYFPNDKKLHEWCMRTGQCANLNKNLNV